MSRWLAIASFVAVAAFAPAARAQAAPPARWEQLFFPFPIAGAPPQLEQQVQIFSSVFAGRRGSGQVTAAEVGYIATPHLGFVATVPVQLGFNGQASGLGDTQLLAQYLLAGSVRYDNMVSIGAQATLPTAMNGLGGGDLFVGSFVYAAQRLWQRLVFEGNVTGLVPVAHASTPMQLVTTEMVSVLLTPLAADVPLYVQLESNTTFYLAGAAEQGSSNASAPAVASYLAPEIFVGPFRTGLSAGTRVATGVSFNVVGDPVHAVTWSLTVSFDIPNRFGY